MPLPVVGALTAGAKLGIAKIIESFTAKKAKDMSLAEYVSSKGFIDAVRGIKTQERYEKLQNVFLFGTEDQKKTERAFYGGLPAGRCSPTFTKYIYKNFNSLMEIEDAIGINVKCIDAPELRAAVREVTYRQSWPIGQSMLALVNAPSNVTGSIIEPTIQDQEKSSSIMMIAAAVLLVIILMRK